MCWACEEEALWRRYQLELAVERGVMPPGFEAADFEAAGLPVPDKRAAANAAVPSAHSRASGNPELSATPSVVALGPRLRGDERKESEAPANAFSCDSPDGA